MPAAHKTNTAKAISIGILHLNLHDLFDNRVPDDLQHDSRAQHDVSDLVHEEELDVVWIDVKHDEGNRDRNAGQGAAGHAAVSADGADTASQLEPFADHVGQLVQDLGQVSAGALLQ